MSKFLHNALIMKNDKPSIIVFLENKPFLGRQISQIPFFEELRKEYSGHQIIGVAPNEASTYYLKIFGCIDEIVIYSTYKDNPLHFMALIKSLKSISPTAVFQLRKESFRCNILANRIHSRKTIGFTSSTSFLLRKKYHFDQSEYISFNYLKLLRKTDFQPDNSQTLRDDRCLIIPVAGRIEKMYDINNFIKAAMEIKKSIHVAFVIQSHYKNLLNSLEGLSEEFKLFIDLDIHSLKELIIRSKYIVSNDCGPVHFAHIYDVPRIVLFKDEGDKIGGPISQWFYKTPSSRNIVSPTGNINEISVDVVIKKFEELYQSSNG
jgi:ADP-heptose:LPS heptosyltransferase